MFTHLAITQITTNSNDCPCTPLSSFVSLFSALTCFHCEESVSNYTDCAETKMCAVGEVSIDKLKASVFII